MSTSRIIIALLLISIISLVVWTTSGWKLTATPEDDINLVYNEVRIGAFPKIPEKSAIRFHKPIALIESPDLAGPYDICTRLYNDGPQKVIKLGVIESALYNCNTNINVYRDNQNIKNYFAYGAQYGAENELLHKVLNHQYIDYDALEYLLELGYDPNAVGTYQTETTPFAKALSLQNTKPKIIDLLISYNGDPSFIES